MRENHLFWHRHPIRTGWWWCIPDEQCIWHQLHPEGCVVHVTIHLDNFSESSWNDFAVAALSDEAISLDPQNHHGLFGSWHGPIESPGRDPQSLIIEAEFEIVDDQSEF